MYGNALTLTFESLKTGRLGISAVYGSFLAEAASHCLKFHDHADPIIIDITGDVCAMACLKWCDSVARDDDTWADLDEATEYGAYGVAIVLALPLTHTHRVQRSAKGTGIDYWLGNEEHQSGIFQRTARLEVSGILRGNKNKIVARLREKLIQTNRSDNTALPAYVVIVGFDSPEATFVKTIAEAI